MSFFRSRAEIETEALEKRRQVLRARGVPEAFVEDLATRRESWLGFAGGVAGLVPLLLVLWGWWAAFTLLTELPWRSLERLAAAEGAWLYGLSNPFYWIGLLTGVFVALMLFGWIWSLLYLRNPPHPGPSVAASILREGAHGQGARLTDWLYRRSVAAGAGAVTAEAFLVLFGRHQLRLWGGCALVLAAVMGGCMAYGVQGYWLAKPAGVMRHEMLRSQPLAWREASEVVVGCNATDGDSVLVYDVRFPGWTADLGSNSSPDGIPLAARVSGLEQVDARLRAAGVPRRRWQWADRNPLHPACIGYWASEAGPDGAARLGRLLAVP